MDDGDDDEIGMEGDDDDKNKSKDMELWYSSSFQGDFSTTISWERLQLIRLTL